MRFIILLMISIGLFAGGKSVSRTAEGTAVQSAKNYFVIQSRLFSADCNQLKSCAKGLNKGAYSVQRAAKQLRTCRQQYKKIESFVEYFFPGAAHIYNRAPNYELEKPFIEYQEPVGFQVIESLLFEKSEKIDQKKLMGQVNLLAESAAGLPTLPFETEITDQQLLESLRIELIRIMSLGITGYDAPELKTGLSESRGALESFRFQLEPFLIRGDGTAERLRILTDESIHYLTYNHDFDRFDRFTFLRKSALPLQEMLGLFVRENNLRLDGDGVLNRDADNLFSANAFRGDQFDTHAPNNPALNKLGYILFSEKSLSRNQVRSCASCHQPEKMFTDGLPVGVALDGGTALARNAPGLLYSGFQFGQFWDGRSNTLVNQIGTVLHNQEEMDIDTVSIAHKLAKDSLYVDLLKRAFPDSTISSQSVMFVVSAAIASYLRTLHPQNSLFDQAIQGKKNLLSTEQINGFNLFMGKARCATCHFIPLFNGLMPPYYDQTEYEVLGTTATDDLDHPVLSDDPGRFKVYPVSFYKHAFKTPTLRNVAKTGPYMHNGSFHSLESVMLFYNKGGGIGLGLKVSEQTLSPDALHLNKVEMNNIILFMKSLTDSI